MGDEMALATLGDKLPAGLAVQRVQTQYATAMRVQVSRTLSVVEKKLLEESALLGDSAYYGWGAGKDRVEGPSKHLANSLVRLWGNCVVELLPVQDLADSWIFTASFVDLETGYTLQRQFRQSKKWMVYGKMDEARKEDVRFQIGQSKAVRNVVFNALPQWLIDKGMDCAKGGVRSKIEDRIKREGMPAVQQAAMDKLERLNVPTARVLHAFDRHAVTALSVEDMVIIAGNIKALEQGTDTIDVMFPAPIAAESDAPQSGVEGLKKVLNKPAGGPTNGGAPTPSDPAGAPSAADAPADPDTAKFLDALTMVDDLSIGDATPMLQFQVFEVVGDTKGEKTEVSIRASPNKLWVSMPGKPSVTIGEVVGLIVTREADDKRKRAVYSAVPSKS